MVLRFPCVLSLFCEAELTANSAVLWAPWAAGDGEGEDRRWMNGERGFALKPHRTGEVFIRVRHCPYRISHPVHTAFYGVSGEAARQSISSGAWPTGQRGMASQQCQQQHPLRSGSEESESTGAHVAFQSHLAHLSLPAVLSRQPGSMDCSLHTIWQPLMEQLMMGKLLTTRVWCHEPRQQTVVQEQAPA